MLNKLLFFFKLIHPIMAIIIIVLERLK